MGGGECDSGEVCDVRGESRGGIEGAAGWWQGERLIERQDRGSSGRL